MIVHPFRDFGPWPTPSVCGSGSVVRSHIMVVGMWDKGGSPPHGQGESEEREDDGAKKQLSKDDLVT